MCKGKNIRFAGIVILLFSCPVKTSAQSLHWRHLKGPYSGAIVCSLVKGTTQFEGCQFDSGGVYRSTDFGDSWVPVNQGFDSAAKYTIYGLSSHGQKIFAATNNGLFSSIDDGDHWISAGIGIKEKQITAVLTTSKAYLIGTYKGIYRSSDSGLNWQQLVSIPPGGKVSSFFINDDTLFAGTMNNGIFRSSDDGKHWTFLDSSKKISDVLTSCTNGHTLFVGGAQGEVFRSTNNGDTWESVGPKYLGVVYCISAIKGIVYATCYGRIYLSNDNGDSWAPIIGDYMSDYTVSFYAVDTVLYSATFGGGVFRSYDKGATWQNCGVSSRRSNVLAAMGSTIFTSGDGNAAITSDTGRNWRVSGGIWQGLSTLYVHDSEIYAGTGFHGLFKSLDTGKTWYQLDTGLVSYDVKSFARVNGTLFIGTQYSGLMHSTDNGTTFDRNNAILKQKSINFLINRGHSFYAGIPYGMYLSIDEGKSWVVTGLKDWIPSCLEIIDSIIYVGVYGGGLRSTDQGTSWTGFENGNSFNYFLRNGNILYAATGRKGVMRSFDRGYSWTEINNGLDDTDVFTLFLSGKILYAYARKGIYITDISDTTSSVSWSQLGYSGIKILSNPVSNILSFSISPIESSQIEYTLNDLNGLLLLKGKVFNTQDKNQRIKIDVSRVNSGTYFLRIKAGNDSFIQEILIVH
jgi:photosystem II stability/assembly factor-like uncharacterized protein